MHAQTELGRGELANTCMKKDKTRGGWLLPKGCTIDTEQERLKYKKHARRAKRSQIWAQLSRKLPHFLEHIDYYGLLFTMTINIA